MKKKLYKVRELKEREFQREKFKKKNRIGRELYIYREEIIKRKKVE